MQFEMTAEQYQEYCDEYVGLCTKCGTVHYVCEPDACQYKCEVCETKTVYGVPELLIMGKITFVENKRSILNDYLDPETSGGTEED